MHSTIFKKNYNNFYGKYKYISQPFLDIYSFNNKNVIKNYVFSPELIYINNKLDK